MKAERPDRLQELYEKGLTSLEEERTLSRSLSNSQRSGSLWFDYIELKRNSVPDDLEIQVWSKVDATRQRHRQIISSVLAAAASVLIITVLITATLAGNADKLKTREIAATLEEAMSMIPDNAEGNTPKAIIYEDESIVIYVGK
ncbi:MAG: hypothetical protein IH591_12955 [Bacteroidales bacterium]|nr:hypothetical protein [Bacteroidales bacterium]